MSDTKTMANRLRPDAKGKRTIRTDQRAQAFLDALASGHPVGKAADMAGASRTALYDWRSDDPAFAARWDASYEQGSDIIEEELRRRAVDGWDEAVFRSDGQVGVVRKYSDHLLAILARSRRPERFASNVRVEANVNAKIEVNIADRVREANERRRQFAVVDGKAS